MADERTAASSAAAGAGTAAANAASVSATRFGWIGAIALAVVSAAAYMWIGDWPLGTHVDEAKKIRFVLSNEQDFFHPLFMIQLGRFASGILGYADVENTLALARNLAAIFGGLLVFSTFVLGRMVLSPLAALAVAVAVAVCPSTAVHATFFKEDIFLAPLFVLSVAALIWTTFQPTPFRSVILGLTIGLAASTKYVGFTALALTFVFLLFARGSSRIDRLRSIGIVVIVAVALFAAINVQLFFDLDVFQGGFAREANHAVTGHQGLALWPTATLGLMHLKEGLLPGLGLPLLSIGLVGLLSPFLYVGRRYQLFVILCFVLIWYGLHELSPMKPYGIERYMVPAVPLLLILGAAFLEMIAGRSHLKMLRLAVPLVMVIAAVPAAHSSVRILGSKLDDPRRVVAAVAPLLGSGVRILDPFSAFDREALMLVATNGVPTQTDTVVMSNLVVDRFLRYGQGATTGRSGDDMLANVQEAFEKKLWPYIKLRSDRPEYAYLNATLYVIALDSNRTRIINIAEAMKAYIASQDIHVSVEVIG